MASVTRKRDLRTLQIEQTQNRPHKMLKTSIRYQNVYAVRSINAVDVTSVKKCRPWAYAASETQRLIWVYTFLHMSEGTFSYGADHMVKIKYLLIDMIFKIAYPDHACLSLSFWIHINKLKFNTSYSKINDFQRKCKLRFN